MTQRHIDDDTISLFVKTTSRSGAEPSASNSLDSTIYNDVLDHLAQCEECRHQAAIITTLNNNWSNIQPSSELSDEQHQDICDYLDGLLSDRETREVRSLIETHPDAMRAALHYQSHSESMQAALHGENIPSERTSSETQGQVSWLTSLVSIAGQFFTVRTPLVYTMTATAALFITVLLLTQSIMVKQERLIVASYQDKPTIQYTDKNKLPGVGFFSQSGNTSKPFEGITIEFISENNIKISWPEVEGAELYKIRIQVFNQGKKTILKERSSQTNHTTFQLQAVDQIITGKSNKRYEWVLYGNTRDERMFYAAGGFVISRVDNEDNYDTW